MVRQQLNHSVWEHLVTELAKGTSPVLRVSLIGDSAIVGDI